MQSSIILSGVKPRAKKATFNNNFTQQQKGRKVVLEDEVKGNQTL